MATPAWYLGVKAFARRVVEIYYPDLVVLGADRVPQGPVVVAANHPNSIMDPVILGALLPRKVCWMAKATLFELPVARHALRAFGVIPVHRRHEGGTRETTGATLAAAAAALVQGECVGIFPEGISHDAPRLAPLKTGVGRLAVLAASRLPPGSAVPVLPVALHFLDAARFRSEAVVAVGEPIRVAASSSPEEITERVREGLEDLLAHVEDDDQQALMACVRRLERRRILVSAGAESAQERHRIDVEIARAIRRFSAEEPARVERFRERALAYLDRLDAAGLSPEIVDDEVVPPGREPSLRGRTRKALALSLLLSPLALVGLLQSWAPWRLAGSVAARVARGQDRTTLSWHRLSAGLWIFPGAWIVEAVLVARAAGLAWALVHLAVAPIAGLSARWASRALARSIRRLRDRALAGRGRDLLDALASERAHLLAEVERWRSLHVAARAAETPSRVT